MTIKQLLRYLEANADIGKWFLTYSGMLRCKLDNRLFCPIEYAYYLRTGVAASWGRAFRGLGMDPDDATTVMVAADLSLYEQDLLTTFLTKRGRLRRRLNKILKPRTSTLP